MINDLKAIDAVRVLALDMVQKANSGHPGLPLGDAAAVYVLWQYFLRFNPEDPQWINRDRFILSAGHGSALLYSLLYLYGYDISEDDIKNFRQAGFKTPGHPEYGHTPGVEITTGPLGQGFSSGVGMAVGQKYVQAKTDGSDYKVYVVCSDGDLMEGVASEAASLAGHLQLDNLICVYLDNKITIEGSTELAFTEDVKMRFESYGWFVLEVDGYDTEGLKKVYEEAGKVKNRPVLIITETVIGKDAPGKENSADVHGSPLSKEEAVAFKKKIGWTDEDFKVPDDLLNHFRNTGEIKKSQASLSSDISALDINEGFEELLDTLEMSGKMATRKASGMVLNCIEKNIPGLIGGSADLAPSCNSYMKDRESFSKDQRGGSNIHFGIREHAMGSVLNGLALTDGLIPYGSTFLVFSDYMKPSIRLAALMSLQVVYIFTHDSVFLGEDGPTHQPVEHIAALRAIPGLTVIRPADGYEVREAWKAAIANTQGPTALILTRQGVAEIDRAGGEDAKALRKGAYMVSKASGKPAVSLIASGSELELAVEVKKLLKVPAEIISIPSVELFLKTEEAYRKSLIDSDSLKVVLEAGSSFGWASIAGNDALFITQDNFGLSAPLNTVKEKLGFTPEAVVNQIEARLED